MNRECVSMCLTSKVEHTGTEAFCLFETFKESHRPLFIFQPMKQMLE